MVHLELSDVRSMLMRNKILLLLLAIIIFQINGSTLVYNMKVRRAFSINTTIGNKNHKMVYWLLTALPIWYHRNRTITHQSITEPVYAKEIIAGSLINARLLAPHHWWAELTTGIEKQSNRYAYSHGFHASRTGCDDIVATIGKNWFFNEKKGQISLYGLGGVPTKRSINANDIFDPPVGSRLYAAGIGGEISYSFKQTETESFVGLAQTRVVHFFNRSWFPIIAHGGHLQPGNITDMVFLVQYRKYKNVIECGYNPTFFTHQAAVLPTGTVRTNPFIRNAVFANYLHLSKNIPMLHTPGAIGAGCTFSRSKQFNTHIWGAWLNLTILV